MKKLLVLLLVFLGVQSIFTQDAERSYHRFFYNNRVGLLDQNLTLIIEPRYAELSYPREGYLSALLPDGKTWQLLDSRGQVVFQVQGERLDPPSDGLCRLIRDYGSMFDDKVVFLDLNGQDVFQREFDRSTTEFSQGVAGTAKPFFPEHHVLMNRSGELIKMNALFHIQPFSEGLAVGVKYGNSVGFLNPAGQWAIEPVWDEAEDFHLGLAQVKQDTFTYFIDTRGEVVIRFHPKLIRDRLPGERWFMNSQRVSGDGYVYAIGSTDRVAPQPWNSRTLYLHRDGSRGFLSPFSAIGGAFEEGVASFQGSVNGELILGFWDTSGQIVQYLPEGFIFTNEIYDTFGGYPSVYKNGWVSIMEKDYSTGTRDGWAFLNRAGEIIYVRDIMEQFSQ